MLEFNCTVFDAKHIADLQEQATRHGHGVGAAPAAAGEMDALVLEQHQANFDLWHREDEARDPRATDAAIAEVKRTIDRLNQRRNDLVERIDERLLEAAGARNAEHSAGPLNSETPGMMIDRMSILELKRFHTEEEIARQDATEEHRERNRVRLRVLCEQREDLERCLDELWREVMAGRRRFKLYRQLKMYNDPELNPVVYGGRGGRRE